MNGISVLIVLLLLVRATTNDETYHTNVFKPHLRKYRSVTKNNDTDVLQSITHPNSSLFIRKYTSATDINNRNVITSTTRPVSLLYNETESRCRCGQGGQQVWRGSECVAAAEDGPSVHQSIITCVPKCCPRDQLMVGAQCRAPESDDQLWKSLYFYDSQDESSPVPAPADVVIVSRFPECEQFFQLQPHLYEEDTFLLLNDGSLYLSNLKDSHPPSSYCIDNFLRTGEGQDGSDNEVRTQALLCFQDDVTEPWCDVTRRYVYPALLLVSSVFLGVTLLIYVNVPELRNKLHGKCLISLVSTLLVGYVALSVVSLAAGKMPAALCRFTASLLHLTFLASFFWLNTMCFDIWRTLRKMRTVTLSAEWIRRRFVWYSLYSWGCPLLITIVAVIIQALPDSYNLIRPDFGTDFCWFKSELSLWAYFYGFVLALVVANVILFSLVLFTLCCSQASATHRSRWQLVRDRVLLCLKLFLVMGITWLAEVISWQEGTCKAWIVTDVINSLQGLIIFLVFVCKRRTWHVVQARCARCCGRAGHFTLSPPTTSLTSFKRSDSSSHFRASINTDGTEFRKSLGVPSENPAVKATRESTPFVCTTTESSCTVHHERRDCLVRLEEESEERMPVEEGCEEKTRGGEGREESMSGGEGREDGISIGERGGASVSSGEGTRVLVSSGEGSGESVSD